MNAEEGKAGGPRHKGKAKVLKQEFEIRWEEPSYLRGVIVN